MTALPEAIFDTYKRYKNGTNRVISFLYQHGRESTSHPPSTPKSKSNAKAKASPESNVESSSIKLRDLIPLANSVVEKGLKVPSHLLSILGDVISARSSCAKWYRKQSSSESSAKHETHEHFIRVLEEIHKILKPAESHEDTKPTRKKGKASQVDKLDNLFEYLEHEEPLESESKGSGNDYFANQTDTRTVKAKHGLTPEESRIEEQLFAWFCFFLDAFRMRKYIGDIWTTYMAGECGLASVAVTTNAAFDLMRRANEDLIAQFPDMNDHAKVIAFFQKQGYHTEIPRSRPKPGLRSFTSVEQLNIIDSPELDPANSDVVALATLLCTRTWSGSVNARINLYPFVPPITIPESDRPGIAFPEEIEDEDRLLIDYAHLGAHWHIFEGQGYQILDGFGVQLQKTDIPSWLVLAVETVNRLRWTLWLDGTQQPYEELQTYLETTKNQISQFIKFIRTWKDLGFPNLAEKAAKAEKSMLGAVQLIAMWSKRDVVQQAKVFTEAAVPGISTALATGKHFLLKHDPVLCGLVLSQVRTSLHDNGLGMAFQDSIIGLTAQIYNSCQVAGLLTEEWEDMEDLIAIHALDKTLFVGSRPDTPEGCLSRAYAFQGISIQARAKGGSFMDAMQKISRGVKLPYKLYTPKRKMKRTSAYADLVSTLRSDENFDKRMKFCPANFTAILPKLVDDQVKRYLDLKKNSLLNEFQNANLDEGMIKQWQKHGKLDQFQMLDVLHRSLEADDFHFNFDYFSMAERCARFLCTFDKAARTMGKIPSHISQIIPEVWVALAIEYWVKDQPGVGAKILEIASDTLKPIIENEGRVLRQTNISTLTKNARYLSHVDIKGLPTLKDVMDCKSFNPLQALLMRNTSELSVRGLSILMDIDPQCGPSDEARKGMLRLATYSKSRVCVPESMEALAQTVMKMSDRELKIFNFLTSLEISETELGEISPEMATRARRIALATASRPNYPIEPLEAIIKQYPKRSYGVMENMKFEKELMDEMTQKLGGCVVSENSNNRITEVSSMHDVD